MQKEIFSSTSLWRYQHCFMGDLESMEWKTSLTSVLFLLFICLHITKPFLYKGTAANSPQFICQKMEFLFPFRAQAVLSSFSDVFGAKKCSLAYDI